MCMTNNMTTAIIIIQENSNFMYDFLLYALLAGIGIALISGPLGSFVVWRRLAYVGDTLAHSSLLGISLGVLLDMNLTAALIACSIVIALFIVTLQNQRFLTSDTVLGILAHSTLASGLILASFFPELQVDLMSYLFGDILLVSLTEVIWIYLVGMIVILLLIFLWRPLLAMTVHEEIAQVEGTKTNAMKLALMLMIASVIAIAIKIVGILLITALMIIPAATARRFAKSPLSMAVLASFFGCMSVITGLFFSYQYDVPAGPGIIFCSTLLFLSSLIKKPY